jgi:hypothetical protein
MADELSSANVNRTYTLAASSIAIFTFTCFFLYPRFVSGEANALLFQGALVDLGFTTFSFVFASLYYYRCSLGRTDDAARAVFSRRGDRFWLLGFTLLFLAPTLILSSIGLVVPAAVWFGLWLVYLLFVIRLFPRQTPRSN